MPISKAEKDDCDFLVSTNIEFVNDRAEEYCQHFKDLDMNEIQIMYDAIDVFKEDDIIR